MLRAVDERKKFGAFYTPDSLSQLLCDWAIRSRSETVLEPSFGGCGLLRSSKFRLSKLGAKKPINQIFGWDIDPIAFQYLADMLESPVDLKNFIHGSFLSAETPPDWPERFDTVVANPPYIPYQSLDSATRKELQARVWPVPNIGGRASLWAYFILESLSKLKVSGRMAWILPGTVMNANYAKPILEYLPSVFSRSLALIVRDRIFLDEGTDEETVILLLDDYSPGGTSGTIHVCRSEKLADIPNEIVKWDLNQQRVFTPDFRQAHLSMNETVLKQFHKLSELPSAKTLGDIATVQIGLVTGANEFFILNNSSLAANGLGSTDCKPILSKFNQAPGLRFRRKDFLSMAALDARVYLIDATNANKSVPLQDYLNSFDKERIAKISTFKKRKIWSQPDDNKIPDAFFPVMHHTGPRIVLNDDQMTCTNTTHRLYFKDKVPSHQRRLVAISLLTSFSQLSAEMTGRTYGSGVLKHEPREAEKIKLLLPDIAKSTVNTWFKRIDLKLRSGIESEASALADELIFGALKMKDVQRTSRKLQATLQLVRDARRPSKRSQQH